MNDFRLNDEAKKKKNVYGSRRSAINKPERELVDDYY